MTPGTFDRSTVAVRTVPFEPAWTVTRRGQGTRPASAGLGAAAARGSPVTARLTGRAVTDQAPGLTPRTSAVTATGPLPGTMPLYVSSCVNVSPGPGLPVTSVRWPVNRTVAVNGSPSSPGSSQ